MNESTKDTAISLPEKVQARLRADRAVNRHGELEAVALGIADRYTFETLAEATRFREKRLSEMVKAGKRIEEKLIGSQCGAAKDLTDRTKPPPEICLSEK